MKILLFVIAIALIDEYNKLYTTKEPVLILVFVMLLIQRYRDTISNNTENTRAIKSYIDNNNVTNIDYFRTGSNLGAAVGLIDKNKPLKACSTSI